MQSSINKAVIHDDHIIVVPRIDLVSIYTKCIHTQNTFQIN